MMRTICTLLATIILSSCFGLRKSYISLEVECHNKIFVTKQKGENTYKLLVVPHFSDSTKSDLDGLYFIEPFLDDKGNVSLHMSIRCERPMEDLADSYLEFYFKDSTENIHLEPDSLMKISNVDFNLIFRQESHSAEFEKITRFIPVRIVLFLNGKAAFYSSQDLDYFTKVLTCLNIDGLKKWLRPGLLYKITDLLEY